MTRRDCITEKIGRDKTDMRGAIFVHVSHEGRRIGEISLSHKWKDAGTMDKVLSAIGEVLTEIVAEIQK